MLRAAELDALTRHHDGAAFGALVLAGGRNLARDLDHLGRGAGRLAGAGRGAEHDPTVFGTDRVGLDHAGIVDHGIDHRPRGRGGQLDAAPVGAELAAIAHQRFERLAGLHVLHGACDLVVDRERDQPVAVEIEREGIAGRQAHGAERRRDGAGIAHARRHQGREAARGGGDVSQIDDGGVRQARNVEVVLARHEVFIADVVGGGEEAGRVDARMGPEQNAVAIDDEDAAVGRQGAVEERRPLPADHAVERGRGAVGLIEGGGLAAADIEGLPIDDGVLAGLVDGDCGGALALDGGAAPHYGTAIGTGDCQTDPNGHQRGAREHQHPAAA